MDPPERRPIVRCEGGVMDANQQALDQEQAERRLDEANGRLQLLEARAKQRKADGAIAEITGLQALRDRIAKQLGAWKDADQESAVELRDQVVRGVDAVERGAQAASDRLDRLSDANDRWLDAETDQVAAACQLFFAWLGEEWVEDKQAAKDASDALRTAWDDLAQKQEGLKQAGADKKERARRAFETSLSRIKRKIRDIAARQKAGREAPEEQRT
jgi:hypothetical protein